MTYIIHKTKKFSLKEIMKYILQSEGKSIVKNRGLFKKEIRKGK